MWDYFSTGFWNFHFSCWYNSLEAVEPASLKDGAILFKTRGQLQHHNTLSTTFSSMARPARIEFSFALHHITARGDRRENMLEDNEDRQVFLQILEQVIAPLN